VFIRKTEMRIFAITTLTIIILISNDVFSQVIGNDTIIQYPLESISYFCQSTPDSIIGKTVVKYDNQFRLLKTITFPNSSFLDTTDIVEYLYTEFGLLSSKRLINVRGKKERTRIYKYDDQNRLIYEGYDDEKGNNNKNHYTYSDQGKVIENYLVCNYNKVTYTYKYDESGRLISEYENNQLICTFEYSGELLIKKTQYSGNRNTITIYEYDEYGNLVFKKENGKVIEHNKYENNRIVEKWIYYFGKEHRYSPCCNQYIMRYSYIKE
jgi:hypothetical protein